MDNEPFYKTLSKIYEKDEYQSNIAYLPFPNKEKMKKFIKCFEHNCDININNKLCEIPCHKKEKTQLVFLDKIPLNDREEIAIKILKWGQKYYRNKIFHKPNKTKQQTKRERTRDIRVLHEAQKIIAKFLPKKTSKANLRNGITITNSEPTPIMDIFLLEDIENNLKKIRLDIEKSEYKIIPKEYYRGSSEIHKEELKNILKGIIEKYNLIGKKEVDNFIVWLPNP